MYNKIDYFRRNLTWDSSEFIQKSFRGWAEILSGNKNIDEALPISSIVDDSVGEDGVPNFEVIVSTKMLMKLLDKSD